MAMTSLVVVVVVCEKLQRLQGSLSARLRKKGTEKLTAGGGVPTDTARHSGVGLSKRCLQVLGLAGEYAHVPH